ncbi:hypothetical protein VP1G_11020 [Cytospora mali]|uniref:Uncharacterized protein n=1 Tax=Cytospora mali TaxID=578113 RepID=A0A194V3B0_CYTMA|nr:hypothetical protein VP1G_11020 [Valsa mali var. pyri (nom. inval.)]
MTAKCYDYNDNEIAYYIPCCESTNGEAEPCCNPMFNDSCASNGLCVTGVDTINPPYFFDGYTAFDDVLVFHQCAAHAQNYDVLVLRQCAAHPIFVFLRTKALSPPDSG